MKTITSGYFTKPINSINKYLVSTHYEQGIRIDIREYKMIKAGLLL